MDRWMEGQHIGSRKTPYAQFPHYYTILPSFCIPLCFVLPASIGFEYWANAHPGFLYYVFEKELKYGDVIRHRQTALYGLVVFSFFLSHFQALSIG
jgi:hypothetical protein